MSEYEMIGHYDDRSEAIVAALDQLTEPGQQLLVHAMKCVGPDDCTCKPLVWTYPE